MRITEVKGQGDEDHLTTVLELLGPVNKADNFNSFRDPVIADISRINNLTFNL